MDRAIGEMRKTERRKVLASVSAFTIGNSVYQAQRQCQLPPKHSLGRHSLGVLIAALNWGEPWHSELTQILPLWLMEQNKAESDRKQVFMGEREWKSGVSSQQFGQDHWSSPWQQSQSRYQICHWWKEISSVLALVEKGKDSGLVHIRALVW